MWNFKLIGLFAVCALLILSGCDPIARHKVVTTIFDGVPSLPPPEQLCEEYAVKKVAEAKAETDRKEIKTGPAGSEHPPYQEKHCDDCHDKSKEGGLIRPKNELCYVCHTDFIKGAYVHGPVAAADCLNCHEPHTSSFPKLLKKAPEKICAKCHIEKRVTAAMHDRFIAKQLYCVDCHDPHFGNVKFFLK